MTESTSLPVLQSFLNLDLLCIDLDDPSIQNLIQPQWTSIKLGVTSPLDTAGTSGGNFKNIDRIRVDLWATNGTLTLGFDDGSLLGLADFVSCADRTYSGWQCKVGDRNLTFVTEPNHAAHSLEYLEYTALNWNTEDKIVALRFDSNGGPSLDPLEKQARYSGGLEQLNQRQYWTIHDDCSQANATIAVPIPTMSWNPSESGFQEEGFFRSLFQFNKFGTPDIIFLALLGSLIVWCCSSVLTCIRCWGARGVKIYPETTVSRDSECCSSA